MAETNRRLAAIMFTDVVGYSAIAQRDEALALRQLEEHRQLLRPLFEQYQGREIKTIGDAFLIEFSSAVQAIRCAVAVQTALRGHSTSKDAPPIQVRIGIHLGDIEVREGDLYGDGVNIASRLEPLAPPGGICLSQSVYEQVRGKVEVAFDSLGRPPLKNIGNPVEVYAVKLPWQPIRGAQAWPGTWRGGLLRAAPFVGVLLLAALAAWWWAGPGGPSPAEPAGTISLAVLPFTNISEDVANEYFSDGITEELLNALAQVKGLRVPARTSAFAFKGKNEPVRKIGEELNVSKVLEGSVRKDGNRVRITAQLINVADGFHLWSQTYDREVEDIFQLQEEIARAIADALKLQLLDPQAADLIKPPTDSVAAYNLYLQGRFHWNKRNEEGFNKAIDYFQQALEVDPNFALAYVGIADSYSLLATYGYRLPREVAPLAKEAAEKALKINDTLAEAHTSIAFVQEFFEEDWEAAERGLVHAIDLNPSYATAHHWYATLLQRMGRTQAGLVEIEKALALDPLSPIINMAAATFYDLMGQPEAALAHTEKALEIDPTFQNGLMLLARLKQLTGDVEGAESLLMQMVEQHPTDQHGYAAYGQFLHTFRHFEAALEQYEAALAVAPDSVNAFFGIALADEMLGRWDEAGGWYQKAVELAPDNELIWALYGINLFVQGRTQEALAHLATSHGINPNDANVAYTFAVMQQWSGQPEAALAEAQRFVKALPECACSHALNALILLYQDQVEASLEAVTQGRAVATPGDQGTNLLLDFVEGVDHAKQGQTQQAVASLDPLLGASIWDANDREIYLAWLQFALGDEDQGFAWLERAYEARGRNFSLRWINVQPEFEPYHNDPRFIALLEKLGLR